MHALIQRFRDWQRERRIALLCQDVKDFHRLELWAKAEKRATWARAKLEIDARSPDQVARMERDLNRRLGIADLP